MSSALDLAYEKAAEDAQDRMSERAGDTFPCERGENGEGDCHGCATCYRAGGVYHVDPSCNECKGTGCSTPAHRGEE